MVKLLTLPKQLLKLLVEAAFGTADTGLTREQENWTQMEACIYVGGRVSRPPPDVHAVLCLSESQDPYEAPVHRWQPVSDCAPAPSLDWLRAQVDFVSQYARAGRLIYIHCDAGLSRSVLVYAAYLMWKHDWPRQRALGEIRKRHPLAQPNDAFMRLLDQWRLHVADHPPIAK